MTQAMGCFWLRLCAWVIQLAFEGQGNATAVKTVKSVSTEFIAIWRSWPIGHLTV